LADFDIVSVETDFWLIRPRDWPSGHPSERLHHNPNIELQYYEHEGGASCRLQWSYPGQATQPIPKSQLFPD
jgi:hypothetical protein